MADQPVVTMIAGPNGSGKSTLTEELKRAGVELGRYINADEIDKTLDGEPSVDRSRRAQHLADEARQACLEAGISFTFETVMSHPSKIELLKEARSRGYAVVIYFVALEDSALNIERVRQRVLLGGHPVPEDLIGPRYDRCLALLPDAIAQCDRAVLFDNSYRSKAGGVIDLWAFCEIKRIVAEDGSVQFDYLSEHGAHLTIGHAGSLPRWSRRLLRDDILLPDPGPGLTAMLKRHGRRISDFGVQLRAKQRLKGFYGDLTEKQFRSIVGDARQIEGDAAHNLLILLERRLDMIVYRAKLAPTVFAARQLVSHGHVRLNGAKCVATGHRCGVGDEICLEEKAGGFDLVAEAQGQTDRTIPAYLSVNHHGTVVLTHLPRPGEIAYPVQMEPDLAIEFYSR